MERDLRKRGLSLTGRIQIGSAAAESRALCPPWFGCCSTFRDCEGPRGYSFFTSSSEHLNLGFYNPSTMAAVDAGLHCLTDLGRCLWYTRRVDVA